MRARLDWLFTPQVAYKDPLMAQRARGLLIFFALAFALTLISAIVQLIGAQTQVLADDTIDLSQIIGIISPLFIIIGFGLIHRGFYEAVAIGNVLLSLLAILQIATDATSLQGTNVLALALPLVSAGVLLGWRSTIATTLVLLLLVAQPTLISPSLETNYLDFFVIALVLIFISFFLVVFGINIQNAASKSLAELTALRQMISTSLKRDLVRDEVELARDVIDLIRDNLGFPFARLFMVENNEIRQRIQTGLNRKQMTVDTDFELSTTSAIYEAVRTKSVVAINSQSPDALRAHVLQGTRGALAVPISFENEVTAVLDIQSEDLESFSSSDISVIRFVAQQLGTALGQSNRLAELRKELSEQESTMARQTEKLLSFERRERQATTQAWVNYLKQRGMNYMGFDINNVGEDPNPAFALNDDLQPAIQTGEISLRYEGDQQVLSVPIILRGYTLGAMSFRVPEGSQTIGPRQQELIRSVVQRLGLALENKRLFEQSQSQAQRESKANEVGSLLLSSTDIDTVLRMAADSFNQAMGAVQTQIRLRPESPELNGGEGAS